MTVPTFDTAAKTSTFTGNCEPLTGIPSSAQHMAVQLALAASSETRLSTAAARSAEGCHERSDAGIHGSTADSSSKTPGQPPRGYVGELGEPVRAGIPGR
jgi:hypothetical protein